MALERSLPLGRPDLTLEQYARVLQVFCAVVDPLERRLQELALPAAFNLDSRLRAGLLLRDLRALSVPPLDLPTPDFAHDWQALTPAQGVGALYVLEGSRLGGAVIARQLAGLGLKAQFGAAYFAPSAHLGAEWQAFQAALASEVRAADEDAVIDGAKLTFGAFISAWRMKDGPAMVRE